MQSGIARTKLVYLVSLLFSSYLAPYLGQPQWQLALHMHEDFSARSLTSRVYSLVVFLSPLVQSKPLAPPVNLTLPASREHPSTNSSQPCL